MARTFERWRRFIIDHAAKHISGAEDTRVIERIKRFCVERNIPATEQDIQSIASEALRRRMVEKFKELQARIVVLETQVQNGADEIDTLRNQLIALNNKVNSYHP